MAAFGTVNTAAAAMAANRPPTVTDAIRQASEETGVDFSYLLEKAAVESSLNPTAKARTSSATGLYQFINSTWLDTVKKHGAEHGLGRYANAIEYRDGRPSVSDSKLRQEILDLRKNPKIAALMVGEFTKDNQDYLRRNVGGDIGSTDLYMAHFLGPAGAAKFLNAMRENPDQLGRNVFPAAAAANYGVFYSRQTGQPQTLLQIYERFSNKFSGSDADQILSEWRSKSGGSSWEALLSGNGVGNPLNGGPLSSLTKLALAALETPLEKGDRKTAFESQRVGNQSGEPRSGENEFRHTWHTEQAGA